jgi:hypothetical protein
MFLPKQCDLMCYMVFTACFGGTILNDIGPAITASFGVLGYIVYIGSLWCFDQAGKQGLPTFADICIGISGVASIL